MPKTPDTIAAIIQQIGQGLRGGLVYVGASNLKHLCPRPDGECRPAYNSKWSQEKNDVDFNVGLRFDVNGKRGEKWQFVVAYELNDTYTVWFSGVRHGKRDYFRCDTDVYCDELQSRVEQIYDEAIKERNGGFINIG